MLERKEAIWEISTYYGPSSICINMEFDGKKYHRHDYGGIFPRWMRIGWYIWQIQKESGCKKYTDEYVRQHMGAL